MLTFPTAFANHLAGRSTSLTLCWYVQRANGDSRRGTAHNRDITIDTGSHAGTYPARAATFASPLRTTSDGSIGSASIDGFLKLVGGIGELSVAEIESGIWDGARARLLMLNWKAPNDGQKVLMSGSLGAFVRDTSGRFQAEVRGLSASLNRQFLRSASARCDVARLGDTRCKFDIASKTRTGTVTTLDSARHFIVTLAAGAAPLTATYYDGGYMRFTSGANNGFELEVRSGVITGSVVDVTLYDEAPGDVALGDAFELEPGCNRLYDTCLNVHDNLVNFRGHAHFASGADPLLEGVSAQATSNPSSPPTFTT